MEADPEFLLLDTSRIAVDHTHPTVLLPGCALFFCTIRTSGSHGYPLYMSSYCETVESIIT